MKKKGFTLIELLAVIVILAIIALIATPIVMNTIENSKKGAAERSADNYMDAVETEVAKQRIDGVVLEGEYAIQADGSLCEGSNVTNCEKPIKIDMSGNKPSSGTIKIANGLVTTESTMIVGDYNVSYDETKKTYVATKEESGENTTTTVYRWSTDSIKIGDTIDPTDTTKFKTDPTTLGKDYYLKHTVENNVVTESYACIKYNNMETSKEACVRGGSAEYYGWYPGNEANYTGNALILKGLRAEGFSCSITGSSADCGSSDGSIRLQASPAGDVIASAGFEGCRVDSYDDGSSSCW